MTEERKLKTIVKEEVVQPLAGMEADYAKEEDLKSIEECIRTLNREMGEVQGELRWIKYILGATFLVAIAQFIMPLFT
jgi:hypothetical protein